MRCIGTEQLGGLEFYLTRFGSAHGFGFGNKFGAFGEIAGIDQPVLWHSDKIIIGQILVAICKSEAAGLGNHMNGFGRTWDEAR